MPTTFRLCRGVHKCQNFDISFYNCNNVKLKLATRKKSLSQNQFRRTFLERSCPGSITVKMSSHKCYIRHRLCDNQAHFAPHKLGPILKKFIVGSIKNGLTTSQIRKKCVHDLGLTLRKFDVTNIKERENLKNFKTDANDHISSLTYATDNFICEHNLREISDLKNAVIIIKSTTTEISGKILLLDSTHKISR